MGMVKMNEYVNPSAGGENMTSPSPPERRQPRFSALDGLRLILNAASAANKTNVDPMGFSSLVEDQSQTAYFSEKSIQE